MRDNNEKFKCLKPFLQLFVFSLLSSTVLADNSTDYSDDDMETLLLIEPAPQFIPQCGANELYQSCEVSCINCEQRGMCEPQNCHINHCDCKMYFVHVTPGGPCEHVSLCPPRECPENEVYRHCGPFCEACDMSPCRSMECSSRCYCKEGYRRNRQTGMCVPENECPERLNCLSNDVVAQSGPVGDHCLQTESEILRANETIEEEKCYCESGYKRNVHGWCIEESSCIYVTCFEETVFQDCPRKCNTTCWNYGDPNCEEDGQCYPSCFCREGYVLNEYFACIPLESCPPGSNPFVPPLPPPISEPALEETSNASAMAMAESSSAAASESRSDTGSSSAASAGSISDTGSSSAAAESSSGTGSGSAAAAESSSGTESSSAAAESSSTAAESSSAAAESSSAAAESSSATAESSSGAAESGSAKATESETATESSLAVGEATEKSKETELEETSPEDRTTEAPKKHPKKATNGGKIYKSAARPGKTVSGSAASSSSKSSSAAAAASTEEE